MNPKEHAYDSTKFRILMIHGFAGSPSEFRTKSSRIVQRINELVTPQILEEYPGGIEFLYPNGPWTLEAPIGMGGDVKDDDKAESKFYAWWHGLDTTSRYKGVEAGLSSIARYIHGRPIHAIVGFSQGAALGGMITSLLECHNNPDKAAVVRSQGLPVDDFLGLPGQKPLRFYIGVAGFRGTMEYYGSLYRYQLQTPSCHAIAKFDTMVEHYQTMDLVHCFETYEIVHYFGSHYTPRDSSTVDYLANFALRNSRGESSSLFRPSSPISQADSEESYTTARSDRSARLFPTWQKPLRKTNVTVGGRLGVPQIRRVRSFNW
ncbi:hypothetical protein MYU51_007553 [Penicillium brevicompactum]|uniref:Serine hydrolase-domain-containing protein n=1 Tax=Penicillium brevicompactum TaxID=5074 RepID=A0A9W9UPX7_PENBR|nr:serine hydrolase-domain-containing protein [Penicillium brevicompactum]KAJ5332171.1 serine hydrolase-domain-containing protein [Penicillium brevicompactum]KAJ5351175.1 serine hydrolase-domain-containing protein [Penicillium brevicompactum]